MGNDGTRLIVRKKREHAKDLISHPGFVVPELPKMQIGSASFNKIVEWTCEAIASFISPSPKEDNEDESFSCDDLAQAIREELPKILKVN